MEQSKIANPKAKIAEPPLLSARAKLVLRILMALIAVAVMAADQRTKALVEARIPEQAVVTVIPGFFNLTNTKNSGAVFGIFAESTARWKRPLLIGVSALLLIGVVGLVARSRHLRWQTSMGLALILGGALSNLYDRVMRAGLVEDFLDFYIRSYHWATFNLADSAIVVGTALIVLQVLFAE
jgi:signal peptidase II